MFKANPPTHKKKSFYYTLKKTLHSEKGVIDLASIMVGTIVTGLIGGVVASTVFVVIPWTQDNAAKQQLDSIVSAENAYFGLSADPASSPLPAGSKTNTFADSTELAAAKLLGSGETYCVSTPSHGKGYEAYVKSESGNFWLATDTNPVPVAYEGSLPSDCSSLLPLYVDESPTTTTMTYQCDTDTTAMIPMNSLLVGTEKWSDGVTQTYTGGGSPVSRSLTAGVKYTMTFEGTYRAISAYRTPDATNLSGCLLSVDHWGTSTGVTNASYAFFKAGKLTSVPAHIPTTITNMTFMFNHATLINDPNISKWDVSNVVLMENLFWGATTFNQPLNHWNVSKVTHMTVMFAFATSFNQPLNNWDVSNVINMSGMFAHASAFNQPLNHWNVSNVVAMRAMFENTANFDQPLDSWNVGRVTDMAKMFSFSKKFSQPLSTWNTSKVNDMTQMFYQSKSFNQNISMWSRTSNPTSVDFRTASILTAANSPFGI